MAEFRLLPNSRVNPKGKVHHAAGSSDSIDDAILPYVLASDATLVDGKVVGDPTEGALLVLAYKAGLDIEATRERLAGNLDQLLHRASPKTIVRREVTSVKRYFVDESGAPRTDHVLTVVGGVVGFVALLVVAPMAALRRQTP